MAFTKLSVHRQHLRLVETQQEIFDQREPDDKDRAFLAQQLIQATLPHRNPRGNPPVWARVNGNFTLRIQPGYTTDKKTGEQVCIGYPYGPIPRLLLYWLNTEVVRTKSRRIELGDNVSAFMREVGLSPDTGGGKRSDAKRLHNQMERLFNSMIDFDYTGGHRRSWLKMPVAPKGELWWDPKKPEQINLWESWIELGEDFYNAMCASPTPLDMRALRELKHSPLALDFYTWLAYRTWRVTEKGEPVFISWRLLAAQMGGDYHNIKDFKRKAKLALRKIFILYPTLRVEDIKGGLKLSPGYPLITSR